MLHTGEYLEIRLTYCLIFNMKKYFERTNLRSSIYTYLYTSITHFTTVQIFMLQNISFNFNNCIGYENR